MFWVNFENFYDYFIFIHSRNSIPAIFLAKREITIQVNFKNELKQPRNLVPLKYWIYQRLHLATYFRNMIAKCFRISLSLYLKVFKALTKINIFRFHYFTNICNVNGLGI